MSPAALAALHRACFSAPPPWSDADFAGLLAQPGTFLLGGETGFVLGRVAADEAELLTLAVAPEARRRGIGRDLLSGFETEAAKRGARAGFLEVAEANVAARALYEGAGWQQAGKRRGYIALPGGSRADALVLRKPLAGPAV